MSPDQVQSLADLARIHLSESEKAALAGQLGAILAFMSQLEQVDTAGIEPLAHPLPLTNVFRDDLPVASLPVDEALINAPDRRGHFFGVPAVLDA